MTEYNPGLQVNIDASLILSQSSRIFTDIYIQELFYLQISIERPYENLHQEKEEPEHLFKYQKQIEEILKNNPFLNRPMSIGYQDFGVIMERGSFYVDKTFFLKEWWKKSEQVSLITRPRRFGKTLLMSMVEHFFSPEKAEFRKHFQKLSVWKDKELRDLHGTIPVIFLSLAGAKGGSFNQSLLSIGYAVYECFLTYSFLKDSPHLSEEEKKTFQFLLKRMTAGDYSFLVGSVRTLSALLTAHYGRRPIILLDEYDTPLTEAYAAGYWEEMIGFYRQFINETFKLNRDFQRALITGITKISKNSLFSDMNHIVSYTCTSSGFSDCFGFTEAEVMDALQCCDMNEMAAVKEMYDGFIFGSRQDIYNPWSICNFMATGKLSAYWINTSSNMLIGELIRKVPSGTKKELEELMLGKAIRKRINEDVALQYIEGNEEAFWALLLASGYIKAMDVNQTYDYTECTVSVTNLETMSMFRSQILNMFPLGRSVYEEFEEALLHHKLEEMNVFLNDLLLTSISYFDTGKRPSEKAPENFFHGLILGLIVSLRDRFLIASNRESGLGRYDIAIIPRTESDSDAYIIEFKVRNPRKEVSLSDTAACALKQIRDRNYEQELLNRGIRKEAIYSLAFAFDGKEALIVESSNNPKA